MEPCYYIPPSLRLHDAGTCKTTQSGPELVRRCSVAASTNKSPTNVPSPTACASLKTGVGPLKLDMIRQYQDYVPCENSSVQPQYRAARNIPGHHGRVGHGAWDLNENLVNPLLSSGRVDDMAEKLANLTMNSGSRPVRPPPPALKAGSWHSNARYLNRSYDMPPARSYPRKAVG